jgi:hypothetical protein
MDVVQKIFTGEESAAQTKVYATAWDWPQTKTAWVIITINLVFVGLATVTPYLMDRPPIQTWLLRTEWAGSPNEIDQAKQAVAASAAWLLAANAISFLSLILLNARSGKQKGTLSDFAKKESKTHVQRFDRSLTFVFWLTLGMFLFLLLVMVSVIAWGTNRAWLDYVALFTGFVYIGYMLINDSFAARAFVHCSRIEPVESAKVTDDLQAGYTDYRMKLFTTKKDLSAYSKIIWFVDVPILLGLIPLYLQKRYTLLDGLFKEGFVMGTIAMHVIAANLISIVIDLVQYREVK